MKKVKHKESFRQLPGTDCIRCGYIPDYISKTRNQTFLALEISISQCER